MRTIGYARVSSDEQHLDLQMTALRAAGCSRIYQDDGVSAVSKSRPGFEAALAALKAGDTFIIWKIDRAFRSLRQSLDTLEHFRARGIKFQSLTELIDTSTPMGEAMYQIQNVFAELERKLIAERTKAGMAEARNRGKHVGRPRKLDAAQVALARSVICDGSETVTALARRLGVSPRTLGRALAPC